jgi:hypothetical protein
MVLLDDVVEILDLENIDQPEPTVEHQQPVHVLQSSKIGAALVDDHFLRPAIIDNGADEEGASCIFIAALRQHEIQGFAVFIDRPIEIGPLTFDLDIRSLIERRLSVSFSAPTICKVLSEVIHLVLHLGVQGIDLQKSHARSEWPHVGPNGFGRQPAVLVGTATRMQETRHV